MTTISQKSAREMLGTPEQFRGGVYVTKNGAAELFIQTAEERDAELAERYQQQQVNAMLKLWLAFLNMISNKVALFQPASYWHGGD
ncbi:hypothetical protein IE983_23800 [Enterobacter hormaechei]|uniref:Uncharacterized protein n=1 Tax=Enterobacter hormaechei TaxID=158836 RepID=A0A927HMF9_9ENTR|nr:hypothetical protein [Enterobacter hormaechei]